MISRINNERTHGGGLPPQPNSKGVSFETQQIRAIQAKRKISYSDAKKIYLEASKKRQAVKAETSLIQSIQRANKISYAEAKKIFKSRGAKKTATPRATTTAAATTPTPSGFDIKKILVGLAITFGLKKLLKL